MTRPTVPPAAGSGEVVEIDAMDGREWEQGQRTPQASDANLAALVKESTTMQEPVAPARPRRTSVVARGRVTGPVPVPAPAPRAGDTPPASAVPATRPTQSPPAATRPPLPTTPPPPATPPSRPAATRPSPRASRPLSPVTTPPAPAEKVTLATPRPAPPAVSARPAISSAATPDPSAGPPKPEPGLGPPPRPAPGSALPRPAPGSALPRPAPGSALPRPAPGPSPSSSRPLSPMQVGVARAGSALDEVRPASLADQEAASGEQPAQGDLGELALGEPALPGPVPVATRAEPIRLLPLPPPAEPTPSPDAFVGPDREAPPPPARDRHERSTTSEPQGLLAAGDRRERSTTSEPQGLLAAASSRRRVLWIGGAAGAVVLVLILVLVGGRTSDTVVSSAQVGGLAQGSTGAARIAVAAPAEPASPPRPPVEPDTSDVQAPPAPAPPPQPRAAAIRPGQAPVRRASGKKLVLEYAEPTGEIAKPVLAARTAEDPAVARARGAYLSGNQKLFAGDAQGAIRAYRQALDFYPGYVGGYRGLGLAYAQLGNAPRALDAFGTYVSLVPGAKDIALIKKRIARLSRK